MTGSTGTLQEQSSEAKFRVGGEGGRPEQIKCPSCSGGNPTVAQNCMWCGQSLHNGGTPTAHLARYAPQPHYYNAGQPSGQIQPYQSGTNGTRQTVVYVQGQDTRNIAPHPSLAPTQVMPVPQQQAIQPANPQYPQPVQPVHPGQMYGQYQGYPQPYQQPPVVIHTTQTVVVVPQKSVGLSILLSFFFGPLGMLYSTVWGGIAIFFLNIYLLFATFGAGWLFTWIGGMIWAGIAASMHNSRAVTTYQQTTTYPPTYYRP